MACHDQLTGALNRVGLDRLRGRLTGALAVLMLDLDNFKPLNDRHGHAMGDAVLKMLATAIAAEVRSEDALVRLGGDEFLIVLPRTTIQEAGHVAERIRTAFADAVAALHLAAPATTISMGIAAGQIDRCDLDAMISNADAALYRAKKQGRDRVAA